MLSYEVGKKNIIKNMYENDFTDVNDVHKQLYEIFIEKGKLVLEYFIEIEGESINPYNNFSHRLLFGDQGGNKPIGPAPKLISAIAKIFRCYSDLSASDGNAEFIGSTTSLPIIRTKTHWSTPQKRNSNPHNIIFVLLS